MDMEKENMDVTQLKAKFEQKGFSMRDAGLLAMAEEGRLFFGELQNLIRIMDETAKSVGVELVNPDQRETIDKLTVLLNDIGGQIDEPPLSEKARHFLCINDAVLLELASRTRSMVEYINAQIQQEEKND